MARGQNQRKTVLEYLEAGHSISQMEATRIFGYTRLAAIIHDLKNADVPIITKMESGKSRDGADTHYAVYRVDLEKWAEVKKKQEAARKAAKAAKAAQK